MEIFLNILFLVVGIVLLIKGADIFVASSSSLAKKLKISALIIGLTIVSFGTSAPELAVSVTSAIKGNAEIATGNVVGSNIMNLLVVLGISAAITPIAIKGGICRKEFPFLIMTQFIIMFFGFDNFLAHGKLTGGVSNVIGRGEGLTLIALLALFVYILVYGAKHPAAEDIENLQNEEESMEGEIKDMPLWKALLLLVVGLAGIVVGGIFIADPAAFLSIKLATALGADQSMATTLVGLTVVAIGTSLPELVTSVIAAKKGENEIAIGNVIGSNIFNTVFILGTSASITPLSIGSDVLIDMVIMTIITFLVFFFCVFGKKISRSKGIVLLLVYALYLTYIIIRTLNS